ncbi:MAG: tRNA (adenosine(37)-N6)-threonylcarbamoyltransferase complex dimerization subunit type 1 TsaB [Thalassovita sp.]|nr:tRNA (adenosine(37)-N6)-threonylcarbamoyltransferase complex dimerization subunit type 1 TsaB [Thalassovita sp.]
MPSEPLVLGFDTSAAHCAAALLSGDRVIAVRTEEMGRGQAERLMPLLEEVLAEGGADWSDLDAIGVGIGPGNFTGIRISVSAARGLSLALHIPAIGVSSFEAIALGLDRPAIPAVAGPRGQAYVAPEGQMPYLASGDEIAAMAQDTVFATGKGDDLACNIAQIARSRLSDPDLSPPAPFYIKAADAAPPRDPAPVILSDDA